MYLNGFNWFFFSVCLVDWSAQMADASYHSPARSVGEPSSLTESENESETLELVTEEPGTPEQTIIDGWLKFRDVKKVVF